MRFRLETLQRYERQGILDQSEARELFWLRHGPWLANLMLLGMISVACAAVLLAIP